MTPRVRPQPSSPAADQGELTYHSAFHSRLLGDERTLVVYLPPGYNEEGGRRYPVLYMQDGQNLFDGRTSFVRDQHWHLNETADLLIREGAVEPLIIVGVYNAGERRIEEYTPTPDPNFKVGGKADLYGRMLVEELKPFIDGAYRTRPGREQTGVGGSSLGGLLSLHLGLKRHDVFGRVIAMSPSLWWDRCWLLRHLDATRQLTKFKLWLDAGTREGANTVCNAAALRDRLLARGFREGEEIEFMQVEGGGHTEGDWAHRAHHVLRFMYPARTDAAEDQRPRGAAPQPARRLRLTRRNR